MTRYLEIKPGSLSEVAIRLRDDYQAFFKKELEKTGKSIASMTDAEKKSFFNRVDKAYNAKNEATSQDISPSLENKPVNKKLYTKNEVMDTSWIKKEIDKEKKTTLVAAPGNKEKVIRIPKEKLADYKAKGYVEAEEFVPEETVVEEPKNAYAIGMAAAMKATGDKPPLKKSTITKAHDIAKKIEKQEEVKEETLEEGGMKEIDTNKQELKRLDVRLSKLKDQMNAAAGADTTDIEKQYYQTKSAILDIKKKLASMKKEEIETVEEAAGPDRLTNLNDKITRLQVNLQKLDKSKPESKTKEAIIKSDLATAKLRLQDLMQKRNTETKKESVNETKKNYKSYKKSLKKEETPKNLKKTMTGQPVTKIDTEPKMNVHN